MPPSKRLEIPSGAELADERTTRHENRRADEVSHLFGILDPGSGRPPVTDLVRDHLLHAPNARSPRDEDGAPHQDRFANIGANDLHPAAGRDLQRVDRRLFAKRLPEDVLRYPFEVFGCHPRIDAARRAD